MMFKRLIPLLLMVAMLFVVSCDNPTNGGGDDNGGGGDGDTISTSDLVGTWESDKNNQVVLNDDNTATISGDDWEDYNNVSWEMENIEWTEYVDGSETTESAQGIELYDEDDDGWFLMDLVFVTSDGALTLVDKDSQPEDSDLNDDEVFTKNDQTGDDTADDSGDDAGATEQVTGITIYEGSPGPTITWDRLDGAGSYMVSINDKAVSDLLTYQISYSHSEALEEGDTIKVEAFSDPNAEDLIATGTTTYGDTDSDDDADSDDGTGTDEEEESDPTYTQEDMIGEWEKFSNNEDNAYVLNPDGTAEFRLGSSDSVERYYEWTIEGNTIMLTKDDVAPIELTIIDDNGTTKLEKGGDTYGIYDGLSQDFFVGTWYYDADGDGGRAFELKEDGSWGYSHENNTWEVQGNIVILKSDYEDEYWYPYRGISQERLHSGPFSYKATNGIVVKDE